MKLDTILVPFDFTECALHGLNYAAALARQYNATITLLNIVDGTVIKRIASYAKEPVDNVSDRMTNQVKQMFRKFLKKWPEKELVKETIVSTGSPFHEIAIKAREHDVDMVVMGGYGSHGKGQLDEIFFGSTVEKVVRLLPCPVLCVPVEWSDVPETHENISIIS
jgi:nucleotide-binding universal stress UspA family protein